MAEKTEAPTPKKIKDARKKGDVAKSKDATSGATMIIAFAIIWASWESYLVSIKELILFPVEFYDQPFDQAYIMVLTNIVKQMFVLVTPVIVGVALVGLMANFAQVGVLFSGESIKPDLKKLNPASGVKRMFSMKNVIEMLKSIVKIVFLGILIMIVIRASIDPLVKIPSCGVNCIMAILPSLLKQITISTMIAFIIVGAADYLYSKYEYTKKLRMTKDEVRREFKEMEGNPEIKGKRKQLHQQLLMENMVHKVKKSSVVVTNPTHIAVALYYDEDEKVLPTIVAMGQDLWAQRIIEIAKQEGIPIMQNVPLARALHETAEVDRYIPSELIEPVAEVLRWVRQLKQDTF